VRNAQKPRTETDVQTPRRKSIFGDFVNLFSAGNKNSVAKEKSPMAVAITLKVRRGLKLVWDGNDL